MYTAKDLLHPAPKVFTLSSIANVPQAALRDSLQAKEDELKAAAEAAEKAPASGGDTNKEDQGSTGTPDADQAAPEAISADEVVAADQVHEHVLLPEEVRIEGESPLSAWLGGTTRTRPT